MKAFTIHSTSAVVPHLVLADSFAVVDERLEFTRDGYVVVVIKDWDAVQESPVQPTEACKPSVVGLPDWGQNGATGI